MGTQDFQLYVNYGAASSFSVVYTQGDLLKFYVAIYDFVHIDPFFQPKTVGLAPLLTLSYMYEGPGGNLFLFKHYPIYTYAPTNYGGQQIIFYNNITYINGQITFLNIYNYNPFIQLYLK